MVRLIRSVTAPAATTRLCWIARLSVVGILLGCGSAATKISAVTANEARQTTELCTRLFPKGAFEATHVVEASIPFSDDTSLIGVVAAQANHRDFRSVLLTQEGIVVFDAIRRGDRIEVVRALPPIERDGFGRHMTDDVKLVLLQPGGDPAEVGRNRQGERICRWTNGNDQVEVLLLSEQAAAVTRLRDGSIVRRARLTGINGEGFASDIRLETTSLVGYQLHLTLLTVERKRESTVEAPPREAGSSQVTSGEVFRQTEPTHH